MLFRVILNCKIIIIIKKSYNRSAIIFIANIKIKLLKLNRNEY